VYYITIARKQEHTKQEEMDMTDLLLSKGYKKWEKKDNEGKVTHCRIYINSLMPLAEEIGHPNPKAYRNCQMYYDVLKDSFVYSVSPSREDTVMDIIKHLRDELQA
jgi:hypothetical protein